MSAVRETQTRERDRPKALNEARREMNRTVSGLEKRLDRRIATFPDGEYVLMTRCVTQDNRTGVLKHHICAVGSGNLMAAVDKYWDDLTSYYPSEEEEEDVDAQADAFLDMPSSATPRAAKLREMLRLLWNLEGLSDTKQIYNAVAKGEAGFSWWSTEFPDIPFTNKAVEVSEASVRIYRVVAPKLYEKLTGRVLPTAVPLEPFVRCERQQHVNGLQQCSLRQNHSGVCDMQYVAQDDAFQEEEAMELVEGEVEEEEQQPQPQQTNPKEFYAALKSVGHKKEPFLKFNAGQIKKLSIYLKVGATHLVAYRLMGLGVNKKYEKWFEKKNGALVWKEIERLFPDYLGDYVLNAREGDSVPKKSKNEIKKTKKKLKKAIRRAIKKLPGRPRK